MQNFRPAQPVFAREPLEAEHFSADVCRQLLAEERTHLGAELHFGRSKLEIHVGVPLSSCAARAGLMFRRAEFHSAFSNQRTAGPCARQDVACAQKVSTSDLHSLRSPVTSTSLSKGIPK